MQSWHHDNFNHQSLRLIEQMTSSKPTLVNVPSLVAANDVSNVRTKRYKAFFKHLTEAEKAEFKSQQCVVLISLGQRYHEGKRLEALLKLANRSFASCNIVVADLLQRHSLKIEYPTKTEAELAELAEQKGKEWALRNSFYIDQLSIPHNVSHWKEWITQNNFDAYKSKVEALYLGDKEHKRLCDSIISRFLARSESRCSNWGRSFNASLKYLMEENAVFCLWAEAGYDIELYPSSKKNPTRDLTAYTSTKIDVMKNYKSPIVAIERR